MKKTVTLILTLIASTIIYGQYNVPITNADVESSTAMSTTNNTKFTIDGMYIQEAVAGSFDEANSGLAPNMGVGGSQALKIVTETTGSTLSWHTTFYTDRVDISGYGNSDFTFSLKIKSVSTPSVYPIWMIIRTFDEDLVNVSSATLVNYANGGKISANAGDTANTYSDMTTDYQTAWINFSIAPNSSSGKNAKFVDIAIQMSKEVNTYYIDNLSLTSSAPLSTKTFETINVTMYPNPTNSKSIIKSDSALENITLYSLTGKLIFSKKVNSNEYALDVSSYAKGLYLLSVSNTKGKATTKIVVD